MVILHTFKYVKKRKIREKLFTFISDNISQYNSYVDLGETREYNMKYKHVLYNKINIKNTLFREIFRYFSLPGPVRYGILPPIGGPCT